MSRRLLQLANVVLALWIAFRAGLTLLEGTESPLYGVAGSLPDLPTLDSNLRFLGGIGLGLAIILLWITRDIERQTTVFRVVWGCRFVGGIGRLISAVIVGLPPLATLVFTLSEVFIIPFLIYWQSKVSDPTAS